VSEWRRAVSLGKRDDAEPDVVEELERGGASVTRLSGKGVPDLLVGFHGRNHLVEVKTGKAGLRDTQVTFGGTWRGEAPAIARNKPQANKLIRMWAAEREREVAAAVEAEREPYPFDTPASALPGAGEGTP
jgi:Holliday junction resolvase